LQGRAPWMVSVHVAGRDRLHAEALGEVAEELAPPPVAALVRTLQLDVEAVAAERVRQPCRGIRIADRDAVARAAGKADQSVAQLLQQRLVERGLTARLAEACAGDGWLIRAPRPPATSAGHPAPRHTQRRFLMHLLTHTQ